MKGVKFQFQGLVNKIDEMLIKAESEKTFIFAFKKIVLETLGVVSIFMEEIQTDGGISNAFTEVQNLLKKAVQRHNVNDFGEDDSDDDRYSNFGVEYEVDQVQVFLNSRKPIDSNQEGRGQFYKFLSQAENREKDLQQILGNCNNHISNGSMKGSKVVRAKSGKKTRMVISKQFQSKQTQTDLVTEDLTMIMEQYKTFVYQRQKGIENGESKNKKAQTEDGGTINININYNNNHDNVKNNSNEKGILETKEEKLKNSKKKNVVSISQSKTDIKKTAPRKSVYRASVDSQQNSLRSKQKNGTINVHKAGKEKKLSKIIKETGQGPDNDSGVSSFKKDSKKQKNPNENQDLRMDSVLGCQNLSKQEIVKRYEHFLKKEQIKQSQMQTESLTELMTSMILEGKLPKKLVKMMKKSEEYENCSEDSSDEEGLGAGSKTKRKDRDRIKTKNYEPQINKERSISKGAKLNGSRNSFLNRSDEKGNYKVYDNGSYDKSGMKNSSVNFCKGGSSNIEQEHLQKNGQKLPALSTYENRKPNLKKNFKENANGQLASLTAQISQSSDGRRQNGQRNSLFSKNDKNHSTTQQESQDYLNNLSNQNEFTRDKNSILRETKNNKLPNIGSTNKGKLKSKMNDSSPNKFSSLHEDMNTSSQFLASDNGGRYFSKKSEQKEKRMLKQIQNLVNDVKPEKANRRKIQLYIQFIENMHERDCGKGCIHLARFYEFLKKQNIPHRKEVMVHRKNISFEEQVNRC